MMNIKIFYHHTSHFIMNNRKNLLINEFYVKIFAENGPHFIENRTSTTYCDQGKPGTKRHGIHKTLSHHA